jgi:hypothetical protein
VSDHCLQIGGDEIAEALSIAPLGGRQGWMGDDER